ncbi:MAG: mismatch-specific DNA-glycosylase [Thermoflexaceae bacterium]|nr:mismatch-specific DNA-glycosylase [Thermoflexaceae bacterium]
MSETDRAASLPHYLRPGLRLVFIGYNPAIYSARAGHYYARPANAFWRQLSASGLVHREVGPEDDALLMDESGIGFVDLCCRPTVRAEELTRSEIVAGALRLHSELLACQPGVALFSGRGIYQHFGRHALMLSSRALAGRAYGEQPERIGVTVPWVVPSSSGLARRWHGERLDWLRKLAAELASPPMVSPVHSPAGGS